mmetsp:Transcript_4325/g.10809  ORF Transcript_4325/g.10809 Transcript_4325/m.10809 type:complete len:214 (+) Transcript_4325:476-1117(+)
MNDDAPPAVPRDAHVRVRAHIHGPPRARHPRLDPVVHLAVGAHDAAVLEHFGAIHAAHVEVVPCALAHAHRHLPIIGRVLELTHADRALLPHQRRRPRPRALRRRLKGPVGGLRRGRRGHVLDPLLDGVGGRRLWSACRCRCAGRARALLRGCGSSCRRRCRCSRVGCGRADGASARGGGCSASRSTSRGAPRSGCDGDPADVALEARRFVGL